MDYEMFIAELVLFLEESIEKAETDSTRFLESKHFFMQTVGRVEQGKADAYYDVLCKLKELEKLWSKGV